MISQKSIYVCSASHKIQASAPESISKHLWNLLVSLVFAPPAPQSTIFSPKGTILGEITIFHQYWVEILTFHLKSRLWGVKSHNLGRAGKWARKPLPTQAFEGIRFQHSLMFYRKQRGITRFYNKITIFTDFHANSIFFTKTELENLWKGMQIAVSFAPCPPKPPFHLKGCYFCGNYHTLA